MERTYQAFTSIKWIASSLFSAGFSTWLCTELHIYVKTNLILMRWTPDCTLTRMTNSQRRWKMIHSARGNASPLMCSHVTPLKEKASFFWAVWRFVPSGAVSGGVSLSLSVVCRNTGWGVSALVAVILQVNSEGEWGYRGVVMVELLFGFGISCPEQNCCNITKENETYPPNNKMKGT